MVANQTQTQTLAKSGIFSLIKEEDVYKIIEDRYPYVQECAEGTSAEQAIIACWRQWIRLADQTEWIQPTYDLWHMLKQIKPELNENEPIGAKVVKTEYAIQFQFLNKDKSVSVRDYVTQDYYRQVVLQHEAFMQDVNEGTIVPDYEEGLKEFNRVSREMYCVEEKKGVYYCIRADPVIRSKDEAVQKIREFIKPDRIKGYKKIVYKLDFDPDEIVRVIENWGYVQHCDRVGYMPTWEEEFVFQADNGYYEIRVDSEGGLVLKAVPDGHFEEGEA